MLPGGMVRRSWLLSLFAAIVGFCLYAYDDWCDALHLPSVKAFLGSIEFVMLVPGLALMAFTISENFRLKERAYADRLVLERERRFQFLGRIAASVAHEIRNPLHNQRLLLDELRLVVSSGDRLLDRIDANLDRLDHAVSLVYELASPGGSPEREDAQDISLPAVVEAAIDQLSIRLPEAGGIVREAPVPFPRVRGSVAAIQIVAENLLRNAVQSAAGSTVRVSFECTSVTCSLIVRNPGSIPPEVLAGDTAWEARPGGLGIGIAIARTLAQTCGGDLLLHNEGGQVVAQMVLRRA